MVTPTVDGRPSLGSDNHSGIHPRILEALLTANVGHAPAYGTDAITRATLEVFRAEFGPTTESFFVFNGTAANVLCLRALVEPHQSIITSSTAHLHHDECGAPEYILGSKLHLLPATNGKIHPEQARSLLVRRGDQHYSQPAAVSLTQPTEVGTVYSLEELRAWGNFCRDNNLRLHIDGARLGVAATSLGCSLRALTFDIGADAVSLGGTKNGLLFGEACVFRETHKEFHFYRKQTMQLPSKMRFLSAMLGAYLTDNTWREIALHEIQMARHLEARLARIPRVTIVHPVQANSVFVKFPKAWTGRLRDHTFFYIWDEQEWVARLMCSFDTQPATLDALADLMLTLAESSPPQ